MSNVDNPNIIIRNSSGTELATSGNPLRVDPTGTTPQPATQSGNWSVRNQDGAGNALASATTAPAGSEQALVVRNIPSGTQAVSGTVAATQSGTWNVTNISGTVSLPTGASTSALQTTGNSSLSSLDTKTPALGQALMAASRPVVIASNQSAIPVTGTFFQATQPVSIAASVAVTGPLTDAQLRATPVPVSGTITATNASVGATGAAVPTSASLAGGSVTTGAPTYTNGQMSALSLTTAGGLRVDGSGVTQPISAASLPLPTGAATQATLASILTNTPAVGQATMAASSPVVIASNQSAVPVSGTVTANQGTPNTNTNGWYTRITDGTNNTVVKAASTAAVASDPALVVAISPNNTVPVSFGSQAAVTGTLAATNAVLAIPSLGSASYGLSVAGTWVGTITPEFTLDGTNWFSCRVVNRSTNDILQSITASDNYFFYDVGGSVQLRVRMSTYTSGTATIVLTGTQLETKELLNYSGPDNDAAPPQRHLSLATLTYVDGTLRALRQSNADPTGTEFALLARSMSYGDGRDSYQPEPTTSASTGPKQAHIDPDGRVQGYNSVLTNEGSFREDFIGGTLDPKWTTASSGGGSVSAPASSLVTVNLPTTNGATASLFGSTIADFGPMTATFYAAVNNRRANQTLMLGVSESPDPLNPGACACFVFQGTVNTTVICTSGASSAAADIQQTTITLPRGLNTSQSLRYKIDYSQTQVTFSVSTGVGDDVIVAKHQLHVPQDTAVLGPVAAMVNTGVAAGTTAITLDGVYFANWNRLQIDSDYMGEPLPIRKPAAPVTYSAAATNFAPAASATDVFTITGSATKTVRIKRITFTMVQTTAAARDVQLIKRSTANSGGTSVARTAVPNDSSSPAGTATVLSYTANPTLGTTVGAIRARKVFVSTITGNNSNCDEFAIDFGDDQRQAPVLRGTGEVLAINLNGVTSAGNLACANVEWTEE